MIFGTLRVDWPKKLPTCEAPPNGYAFLVFDTENGVKNLMNACFFSENRYIYTIVTAKQLQHPVGFSIPHDVLICFFPLNSGKIQVEIKVWKVKEALHTVEGYEGYMRWSVFVGAVPRTCTASEY